MPKIRLNGELSVSKDLFGRLQARCCLDSDGRANEETFLYLQECIARDDARTTVAPLAVCRENHTAAAPEREVKVEQVAETKAQEKVSETPSSDLIKARLGGLYGG